MMPISAMQFKGVVAYDPILIDYIGTPDQQHTQLILQSKQQMYQITQPIPKTLSDFNINKPSIDLTLPGYNYLGPGTPTIQNMLEGKLPIDEFDQAALVHDIEYLTGETYYADYNMYLNTSGIKAVATNYLFNLKDQMIFLNSFLAKQDLEAYYHAKNFAIDKGYAPESMFLSGKPKDLQEPSFLYKLTHPIGSIKSAALETSAILKTTAPTLPLELT